jgi:hypothetical protein
MILSHKHKFIFIKTRKTAGSSIETALSGICGPEDVVTTMDPPENGHTPQNWIGDGVLERAYKKHLRVRKLIHPDSILLRDHYYQHMTAFRAKQVCGDQIWNSYFKFCFERNPWDKVVSFYWWKMRGKQEKVDFSDWIRTKRQPIDSDLYCINGNIAMDFIGRFEHLEEDFKKILNILDINCGILLPKSKSGVRKDKDHFSKSFNKEDELFINELFNQEIKTFGYDIHGHGPAQPFSVVDRH